MSRYALHVEKLDVVADDIGSVEELETDSVMGGDTIFNTMACQDEGHCEERYLTAIEDLRELKERAELAVEGFEELQGYSEACEVNEQDLIVEESDSGIEKARAYVGTIEKFIESMKRHLDDDLATFSPDSTFEDGVAQYQEARRMSMMDPSTLEKRVTVYNG